MVSVTVSQLTVSQRLDRKLSWPEYRVEFHPSRTYTSDGNPMLVSQRGKTQKHLAYTFRIQRLTRRQDGDPVLPLPNDLDSRAGGLGYLINLLTAITSEFVGRLHSSIS
jgi:hypothetical protein